MSFQESKRFKNSKSSLLGGEVSTHLDGKVENDKYRRYVSTLDSTCVINNEVNNNSKSIIYEIGIKNTLSKYGKHYKTQMAKTEIPFPIISQNFKVLDVYDSEIVSLHKKISNFSGKYEYMDLSAIVFNLALGIAEFNNTGHLTPTDLRRGSAINVRALGTAFDPITSSPNSLFIPRLVDRIMNPATFCAIAASANAYGTIVYSDLVEVDGAGNTLLTDYNDGSLFDGCIEAIRLIFSMMDKMEASSLCGFALIKGLHTMNTVVSHTDEGGIFRDILRVSEFAPPFGAIYYENTSNFIALPIPSSRELTGVCAVIDSILLVSAAGVSLCDPCVNIDNRVYPTILTNERIGDNEEDQKKNFRISNLAKLSVLSNGFFKKYGDFCANMFGLADNNSEKVMAFLQFSLSKLNPTNNRHIEFETIAPYYFIEPTSLFNGPYGGVAEDNNYGPICFLNQDVTMSLFESIGLIQDMGDRKLFHINFRNPRNNGLFLHLSGHSQDGLAFWTPFNFVDENFCLSGGANTPAENRAANSGIDAYLWGRGQSSIFAPGECNYVGKSIGIIGSFAKLDNNFNVNVNNIPRLNELNGNVNFSVNRPYRITNDKISTFTKEIRKVKTSAALALERANQLKLSFNFTGGFALVPSNTEPVDGSYKPLDVNIQGVSIDPEDVHRGDILPARGPSQSISYSDSVLKIQAKPKKPTVTVSRARETKGKAREQDETSIELRRSERNKTDSQEKERDVENLMEIEEEEKNILFGSGLNISGSGDTEGLPLPQTQ